MNDEPVVVGDADALIALTNTGDANHARALGALDSLERARATIIFPATSFAEAVTAARRKLNDAAVAKKIIELFTQDKVIIAPVDDVIIADAIAYVQLAGSKKNTFFDAITCAICERYRTSLIFSFDRWYAKQGFTLYS